MGYPNNSNFFVKKQDVLINLAKQVAAKDGLITLNSIVENILENVVSNLDPANPQNLNGGETLLLYKDGDLNSLTMMDLYTIFTGGNNDLPEHDISQHSDVQGNPQNGDVLTYNAGYWEPQELPASTGWGLDGNTGTDHAVDFIGNTDDEPLVFRTWNTTRMILNKSGVSIGTNAYPNIVNADSQNNIAIGENALRYSNTDSPASAYNVAIGYSALSQGTGSIPVTELFAGNMYTILTTGDTDFTLVGAADSNPGTSFTASGAGVGTGTVAGPTTVTVAVGNSASANAKSFYAVTSVGEGAGSNTNIGQLTQSKFSMYLGSGTYAKEDNSDHENVIGVEAMGFGSFSTRIGSWQNLYTALTGQIILTTGGDTTLPNANSALEIRNTGALTLPQIAGSTVEAWAAPAAGMIVFINNGDGITINSAGFWGYDGVVWNKLG